MEFGVEILNFFDDPFPDITDLAEEEDFQQLVELLPKSCTNVSGTIQRF